MSKKANPTVIGGFVVGAVILLAAGIALVGGSQLFAPRSQVVTYFEGSVKGLRVGSNVLFRGVRIGFVSDIQLMGDVSTLQPIVRATLDLTPAGPGERATAELELPSFEQRPSGGGSGGSGGGHGEGHDPEMSGGESGLKVAHDDSRLDGVAGEGPTRSQLILGAADRGFASRGYRKVHADYSSHAEEVLEDESVPPGYRYYVRRYFQLIRPRDGRDR